MFEVLFAQIAYNQRRNDGLYVEAAWNVSQNDTDKPNVAATSRETTTNITTTSQRDKWNQASFSTAPMMLVFGFMQWEGDLDITAQIAIAICGCLAIYTGWTAMHVKYMTCLCGAAISWIWMRSAIAAACILAAFVIAVLVAAHPSSNADPHKQRQIVTEDTYAGSSHRKAGSRGDVSESFARRMPAERGIYKIASGQGFVDTKLAKCAIDRQVKT
ncbi:predicted protein [Postia placenta Mad-698-R]|uniref:Uncharacterized protein n=1 Tax=Postia placenta MAD-698-R-SB12 TaxID=670580 RepID=A0A1X6N4B0_9APHY|nr:hypothetical protein POSPLADRAFT_1045771 [Postia placenta MAD-698-R-SB12]EED84503.1 predicted protein [Postia placenta Mad-698-R]OSX63448.1 hypothetical protein POSPLADRAFT_1045771 [Postia placenta MAD-698-R-SB12]